MAWFDPLGDRRDRRRDSGCARRRPRASSAGATRTASTGPSPASSSCSGETCPELVVHAGLVDARGDLPPEHRSVRVRPDRVRALLGAEIPTQEMVERLAPIGFEAVADQGGVLDVSVPSWRPDCELEVDVIEEIARHVGYERLGRTVPKSVVAGRLSAVQTRRRLLRQVLYGLGISEAMPNPFLAPGDLDRAGLEARGLDDLQPAGGRGERAAHARSAPACSRRWPTTRRTAPTTSPCSRSATPTRRPRVRCRTSGRSSASRWPGGTVPPPCPSCRRSSPRSGSATG